MADQVNVPVVDDLEVTLELYETVYVINTLECMKDDGILESGICVNRGKLKAIELAGREFGYAKPSAERVDEVLADILMFPYLEEDDEEETEVQD